MYNPQTGEYEQPETTQATFDVFANYVTNERVSEMYGERTDTVIVVRFIQDPPKFSRAIFEGKPFIPIEQVGRSVRLKEVVE